VFEIVIVFGLGGWDTAEAVHEALLVTGSQRRIRAPVLETGD
jgi:hypothetical protein